MNDTPYLALLGKRWGVLNMLSTKEKGKLFVFYFWLAAYRHVTHFHAFSWIKILLLNL